MTTWARIEARSYEDALQLLERLLDLPSTLVQIGKQEWSIYVAADGPEFPELISGSGVAPSRVTLIESDEPFAGQGGPDPVGEDLLQRRGRSNR